MRHLHSYRFRFLTVLFLVLASCFVAAADKPHSADVTISGLEFKPGHLKIHVGDTVIWTNNDDRDHLIVAHDGSFKSKNIRAGQTFEFRFTKAGTYLYGCSYHPRMKGVVVVD